MKHEAAWTDGDVRKPRNFPGWVALTAWFLAVLWPSGTSHEWLEVAGMIHVHEDSHHAVQHEAAHGHCRIESGAMAIRAPALASPILVPYFATESVATTGTGYFPPSGVASTGNAPPGLVASWQFLRRTTGQNQAPPAAG